MAATEPADVRRPGDRGHTLGALHALFGAFPLAYFLLAFLTDIAYSQSYNLQWQYFSIWLITAGLIMGGLAAVFGFIDYFGNRRIRALRPATPHMLLNLLAMILSLVNAFVHSRDGWQAVVPTGIILSGIVVLILLVSAWLGGSMVYRHGAAVVE